MYGIILNAPLYGPFVWGGGLIEVRWNFPSADPSRLLWLVDLYTHFDTC